MPIEYEYENWEEPSSAKRVWRLIAGTSAIIAFWVSVIVVTIFGSAMAYIALHQSGEHELMILLSVAFGGLLACSIPLMFQVHVALLLWRRCRMAVMVVDDDASEGLIPLVTSDPA